MMHILFGFALISASLQTGWALLCEGHLLALPLVLLVLCIGCGKLKGGPARLAARLGTANDGRLMSP